MSAETGSEAKKHARYKHGFDVMGTAAANPVLLEAVAISACCRPRKNFLYRVVGIFLSVCYVGRWSHLSFVSA